MIQKKSYFLSIDAFVAVVIIVLGFVMINSQFSHVSYNVQHEIYSKDVLNSLIMPLPEYNVDHFPNLKKYKNEDYFGDYSLPLIDYLTRLVVLNQTENCVKCLKIAENITKEIVLNALPDHFSMNITLINQTNDRITLYSSDDSNLNNAKTIIISKKIVAVVQKDNLYPFIFEVMVWS